jgi:hypothetical protein
MKNNKMRLTVYQIAIKYRLILYTMAVLIVLIPIIIVIISNNPFNSFYSEIYINTAITFVILGKILTIYKKTIENGAIPWTSTGSIIGILIVLIWSILR